LAIHVNTTFRGLAQSLTTESPGRLQLIAIEVDLLQLELGLTPAKKALAISRFLQGIAKKHNRYWARKRNFCQPPAKHADLDEGKGKSFQKSEIETSSLFSGGGHDSKGWGMDNRSEETNSDN